MLRGAILFQTGIIASITSPSFYFTSLKLLYSTSTALHGLTLMSDMMLPMGQFSDEGGLSLPYLFKSKRP